MRTIPQLRAQTCSEYHPHFIAAILSSAAATQADSQVPVIEFTTDSDTRRSMTLNGMRMATEFFAHDSPRVLQLIEQRLRAGQRDVVHDVLVYLWERVLLMRANAQEAKDLQAESLAAYLGLKPKCVSRLLEESPLCASSIAQRIQNGEVGKVQRNVDVSLLAGNLLARLQPELEEWKRNENRVLRLIEEIATQLYADGA